MPICQYMNDFIGRLIPMVFIIFFSFNLAQGSLEVGDKYKTFTSCEFGDQFKIEVHQFPETGPRGSKQHIIAYIKHPESGSWKRTRIYLPKTPIPVEKKQRDLSNIRKPASDNANLEIFYFKDDLQKPIKSTFPNIDDNAALLGIIQEGVNAPVSMILKGYFHHWGWGPHGFNAKWSTYDPIKTKLQTVLLQKTFHEMAFSDKCQREYREI